VFDAGCGAGYNLKMYESLGTVFGCDFSEDALYFCQQRGLVRLVKADVNALPYKNGKFDLISMLDVLSHESIPDDVKVLEGIVGLLKDGGHVLLTDNALKILRSPHDLAYHVRERYRKKMLKRRMEKAGLEVLRMSYFNFFLFPAIFFVRFAERIRGAKTGPVESDLKAVPRLANSFLFGILKFEALLMKKINLPWGSSLICLARKIP